MPLPAYITEQPKSNPTDVVARQINNLGLNPELHRCGSTLTVRGIEYDGENGDAVMRAIKLINRHADAYRLSTDVIVYPVQGNVIDYYLKAGFEIHVDTSEEDDEDPHTLLRRITRT